jgi:O-glycosyl hydrolase
VVSGATQYQTIDGFGVNANSLPYLTTQGAAAVDTLIDSAGVTHWRVIVESTQDWETTNDNADPASFNWSYYNALYETPKFQAVWAMLAKLKARNAASIMVNVMGNAPGFMGGTSITAATEDEWVEMIVSFMYYARVTKGLRIDALSPLNEEDWGHNEGPLVNASQYVRLMKKVWARLDALGIGDVRLVGPDTANIGAAILDYMPAMMADASLMTRLDRFALHDYSGSNGGVQNYTNNRAFWLTEFSGYCSGCNDGVQPSNDWDFAKATFRYALNHLSQGAAGVFVYDGYDSYYEHHGAMGYWGMLALVPSSGAYVPHTRMYAMAQLARFVRPNARRIGVTLPAGIVGQAFLNADNSITVSGINTSSSAVTLQGALQNFGSTPLPANLRVYMTSGARNLEQGADLAVSSGRFSVQIPADTIFTLTSAP